jgi:gliding motility-associated-like protein
MLCRVFLLVVAVFFLKNGLLAQCNNPVQLISIAVLPSTCGAGTGAILCNTTGGPYEFAWQPSVSVGSAATGLSAGVYAVTITRTGQPECTLDTTLVVSNSDGPSMTVLDIQPSNCLASNGLVLIDSLDLQYSWSNGEVGASNFNLNSGCYFVTATDQTSGCFAITEVCVPNLNPLTTAVSVTKPAKCGRSTGQIMVSVTGGSGVYSYSLGGTVVNGLPPGPGLGLVVDNLSGCLDSIPFDIPDVAAEGEVFLVTNAARCAGGLGNASVQVVPGANFSEPFTFSVTDAAGAPQASVGALTAGDYLVYVVDADSCFLPTAAFSITEPLPISVQATPTAGTCTDGGAIDLSIGGGVPPYLTDWADLVGNINPADRQHLAWGRYAVVVYDSLFCSDTLAGVLVPPPACSRRDTLRMLVPVGDNATLCLGIPTGLGLGEVDFALLGGTSSAFGSWSLTANCLTYSALLTPGLDVDLVCIRRTIPALARVDTVCVRVGITAEPPTEQVVDFTTQINSATLACGTLPTDFQQKIIVPLSVSDYVGTTPFGTFFIDPTTACLTFSAFDVTGFNLLDIAVAVCDPTQNRCHRIVYRPAILPLTDCSAGIVGADTLVLPTSDCSVGAASCLDVVYANILNFNILDNNQPYAQGALGCNTGPVWSYPLAPLPQNLGSGGGPYLLNEWLIDGVPQTGVFGDVSGLIELMNQLDPSPAGWSLENFLNIIGGDPAKTYGPLRVTSATNLTGQSPATQKTASLGSELRFTTGEHRVIFRKIQTGCADTLAVRVECFDCPAIHPYTPNIFGNIEWDAPACGADTVFCTSIPPADLPNWDITDRFVPFTDFVACGSGVGFRFDTGYHEMRIRNLVTTCAYTVQFYFDCRKAPVDTLNGTVRVGESIALCLDTTLLPSPIITIFNICPETSAAPNATLTYDEQNWCANLEGLEPGLDTLCLQLCNADGQCVTVLANVEVLPEGSDKVLIFNGISPNGDGSNDTWVVSGIGQYPDHEVRVFNRWGHLVFQQKNYQNDWEGTWQGQPLPDGTYFYQIDLGDGEQPLSGYLELWR